MAGFGKGRFRRCRVVQQHARVQSQQPSGRGHQRVDVDFLDPRLSHHQLAETHQQLFQRRHIHRGASAHSLQGGEDARAFHHPPGQRRVERRQSQRAVLEDFDQLPAGSKEQHRPELRVDAASNDQLIPLKLDHRLHRHSQKMFLARLLGHRNFDGPPRPPHRRRIAQVQLHPSNIGLVGDRFRIELDEPLIFCFLPASNHTAPTSGRPARSSSIPGPLPTTSNPPGSPSAGMHVLLRDCCDSEHSVHCGFGFERGRAQTRETGTEGYAGRICTSSLRERLCRVFFQNHGNSSTDSFLPVHHRR